MDIETKRRIKNGRYNKQEILKSFIDFLNGTLDEETHEQVIGEFVIVAKSTDAAGEECTDVFSTTGKIHEVIGILEIGKLFMFEHRGDSD